MGYLISLGGCPLIWKSQLLSAIALSTVESEYQSLSHAVRQLLVVKRMCVELIAVMVLTQDVNASVRCRVFEDNTGALLLATNQRLTARTRYYLSQWHWFWSYYRSGAFTIMKVDTAVQKADFLSKPLPRDKFEKNRELVQGW